MFIFFMIIAILVLIALIIFMLIELNAIEQESHEQLLSMKKRYGEADLD